MPAGRPVRAIELPAGAFLGEAEHKDHANNTLSARHVGCERTPAPREDVEHDLFADRQGNLQGGYEVSNGMT
ncbi:hypothetical protein E2562_035465 [Oryza meyeriana var. granulata]|uniref:Uncharacterized protein n=1 Tax=Oryza meyeriana var. granulata TaxID=110450 RepID=A0A6G1CL09_9ORYZ|nr:hypothetical protein E2562_035465 [Oryza meyeriana var. granulata]